MNVTKQSKHFSALKKGDNFLLAKQHLVFVKRIQGGRIVCMTYGKNNICQVTLPRLAFHYSPVIEVW
jgi:hypothetical protein